MLGEQKVCSSSPRVTDANSLVCSLPELFAAHTKLMNIMATIGRVAGLLEDRVGKEVRQKGHATQYTCFLPSTVYPDVPLLPAHGDPPHCLTAACHSDAAARKPSLWWERRDNLKVPGHVYLCVLSFFSLPE